VWPEYRPEQNKMNHRDYLKKVVETIAAFGTRNQPDFINAFTLANSTLQSNYSDPVVEAESLKVSILLWSGLTAYTESGLFFEKHAKDVYEDLCLSFDKINESSSLAAVHIKSPIVKGSVVKYKDGHFRVSARFSSTVNLCGVFGSKSRHKGVPLAEVVEDEAAWFAVWQKSESYQSM
jgi:hypothetical protein